MNIPLKKYFIIGTLVLAHSALVPARRAVARLQRMQQHYRPAQLLAPQSLLTGDGCVGATRAYLSNAMLNQAVRKEFAVYIARYKDIVSSVIALEERHEKTHMPLYHGDPSQLRVYQDLLRLIYTWTFNKPVREDFIFLRWWEGASLYPDVNAFCDANAMEHGVGKHNDSKKEIGNQILSVNFSLFGNTVRSMESTFHYFVNNRSCWISGDELLASLLKTLFDFYKFDPAYIKEIQSLAQEIATAEGSVLQMLMPITSEDNTIDRYVYLVGPDKLYGIPRDTHYRDMQGKEIALADFNLAKKRYTRSSGVLRYRNENVQVVKNVTLDGIQGRLLLNKDILYPERNTIKMSRYTTVPADKMRTYQEKLAAIFKRMVADKEGREKTQAERKEMAARATPAVAAIAASPAAPVLVSKL